MKYNERISEIREDNTLTQQKVADLLNIGQRTYADYESGKTRIPIDSLLPLATSSSLYAVSNALRMSKKVSCL